MSSNLNFSERLMKCFSMNKNFSYYFKDGEREYLSNKYHHAKGVPELEQLGDDWSGFSQSQHDSNWISKVGILDLRTGNLSRDNTSVKDGKTVVEFWKNNINNEIYAIIHEHGPSYKIPNDNDSNAYVSWYNGRGKRLFSGRMLDWYFGEYIEEAISEFGDKLPYYVYA